MEFIFKKIIKKCNILKTKFTERCAECSPVTIREVALSRLHFSGRYKLSKLTFLRMRDKCKFINVQRNDKALLV